MLRAASYTLGRLVIHAFSLVSNGQCTTFRETNISMNLQLFIKYIYSVLLSYLDKVLHRYSYPCALKEST